MPSLLEKLSYYDPDTGRTFVVADDRFYWKQGKKAPEDSKITKLVKEYGWRLWQGTEGWLVFDHKREGGELFVVRGNKRWFYSVLGTTALRGKGLDSLRDALDKGLLTEESLDKVAGSAAIAVNNAGRRHHRSQLLRTADVDWDQELADEIRMDQIKEMEDEAREAFDQDPDMLELAKQEGRSLTELWEEFGQEYANEYWEPRTASKTADFDWQQELADEAFADRVREMEDEARESFERNPDMQELAAREGVSMDDLWAEFGKEYADEYWQPATTASAKTANGLRRRPDYGESDSRVAEMNEQNSKEACLVLRGWTKSASGEQQRADVYVTSAEWDGFRLANFRFSPNPNDAAVFLPRTANIMARQISKLCGQMPKLAKPASSLLTTQNIKTQKKYQPSLVTTQNVKTQKGEKFDFLTGVMHMMPSDLAGYGNVCPCASPECRQMCLNTAGRWANAPAVQNARRMKTELYFKNREQFMNDLRKSIESLVRKAEKQGKTPAIRVNGTSDLPQVAMQMAKEFPDVQFYDYTKIPQPWKRELPNYHITFSRSETNDKDAMDALEHGVNVAVVFGVAKGEPLPKEWRGYPVIDGDLHDLRFLDKLEGEGPFIVGLRGKGKARGEGKSSESGFVVNPEAKQSPLVQIGPALTPKKEEKPEPVSTTEERIKERSRPATTEPEEEEQPEEATVTASATPRNEWFIEGCFDGAHLWD